MRAARLRLCWSELQVGSFPFLCLLPQVCPHPTPPAPPPSPQAWLRSGAGWRESFSLNQYNLPSGSREQICSLLKAASVFPYYEGFLGLSPNSERATFRKQNKSRALGAWEGWAGTQEWVGARVAAALGLEADRQAGGPTGAQLRRSQLGDYEHVPSAFIGS